MTFKTIFLKNILGFMIIIIITTTSFFYEAFKLLEILWYSKDDQARIQLAAAKSVLRLSKRWDLQIAPEIFRLTILTAKVH